MPQIWAGVDIGKEHHHCVVVDERGERLLSRRVFNDESVLLELIADVLALERRVGGACIGDLADGAVAVLHADRDRFVGGQLAAVAELTPLGRAPVLGAVSLGQRPHSFQASVR
ncbi:IS110 family transposase [Streptomyces antimycoticus]|uniref:IS110 family transposase n=1 Tax=Streptomyces antimycoticus TaxID=68175 RepID=UPI003B970D02